jgi:hypothetical protein
VSADRREAASGVELIARRRERENTPVHIGVPAGCLTGRGIQGGEMIALLTADRGERTAGIDGPGRSDEGVR